MRNRSWLIGTAILCTAILGCSGGGGASPGAGTPGPATAEPTQGGSGPPADPGAGASPVTDPTPAGGTAVGVCELVTSEELASILGKPVTLVVLPGPPDTCDVGSNDAPIAAFVFMEGPSFGFAFDAWASDPSAEDVGGIGDRAVYVAASELFIVKRGDRLFSVSVYDVDVALDARVQMMKDIAKIAAGRM